MKIIGSYIVIRIKKPKHEAAVDWTRHRKHDDHAPGAAQH